MRHSLSADTDTHTRGKSKICTTNHHLRRRARAYIIKKMARGGKKTHQLEDQYGGFQASEDASSRGKNAPDLEEEEEDSKAEAKAAVA